MKLNINSSQNTVVTEVSPSDNCECAGTINLGLLEQLHYVDLDKTDNDENERIDNENETIVTVYMKTRPVAQKYFFELWI